jgi:hypothetical protein
VACFVWRLSKWIRFAPARRMLPEPRERAKSRPKQPLAGSARTSRRKSSAVDGQGERDYPLPKTILAGGPRRARGACGEPVPVAASVAHGYDSAVLQFPLSAAVDFCADEEWQIQVVADQPYALHGCCASRQRCQHRVNQDRGQDQSQVFRSVSYPRRVQCHRTPDRRIPPRAPSSGAGQNSPWQGGVPLALSDDGAVLAPASFERALPGAVLAGVSTLAGARGGMRRAG